MSLLISTIQVMWLLPLPLRDNSIIQQFSLSGSFSCILPKLSFSNLHSISHIVTPNLSTSLNAFSFPVRIILLNIWRSDVFFYASPSQELPIFLKRTSLFSQVSLLSSSIFSSSLSRLYICLLNGFKSGIGRLWLFTTQLYSKHSTSKQGTGLHIPNNQNMWSSEISILGAALTWNLINHCLRIWCKSMIKISEYPEC